mgnify:FL=1
MGRPAFRVLQLIMESASDPCFVVVLPTYNNVGTLPDVLGGVSKCGLPMIVVNDGSTDETSAWLQAWLTGVAQPLRRVIEHSVNQGKAAALITGFASARGAGFSHAVTIDTDGQLEPSEIPDLIDAARCHPDSLVIGARNDRADDYPGRSRFGRRFSNLMIRLECGARVEDSQCGMRAYPLRLFDAVHPRAGRYAMETEIITLASWAGFGIVNVPVTCRYIAETRLVSHFRVGRESWQSILLHARLLAQSPFKRFSRPGKGPKALSISPAGRR